MDKQIIVYEPNEQVKMEVKTDGETVWLTIDQMAALFGRDPSVIGKHIKAAFSEEELDDSINRQNLPINGYRVKSTMKRVTVFKEGRE